MVGSMNKLRELQNSVLIFLDEAIGHRRSLHMLHRWFETGSDTDLCELVVQVGREHYIDLWPLINYCRGKPDPVTFLSYDEPNHIDQTVHSLFQRHLRLPMDWTNGKEVMLSPIPSWLTPKFKSGDIQQGVFWELYDWIKLNSTLHPEPLSIIPYVFDKINESSADLTKLVDLLKIFFGDTILNCLHDESMDCFVKEVTKYYLYYDSSISTLCGVIGENPDVNWKDALSRDQIQSKLWLLEKMHKLGINSKSKIKNILEPQTVLLVGGWVGILPWLMTLTNFEFYKLVHTPVLINVDFDKTVHAAASKLLDGTVAFNYQGVDKDIKKYNFTQHKNLIVIDTIVEHFKDHEKWIKSLPKGTPVVLQGNNMFDAPDHVNCHHSLEEFVKSSGLNTILWSGELLLNKCLRFMVIGII